MSAENRFTKDNIDEILSELAKEYKKLTHKNSEAEVVIAGGGAVLLEHDFRDSTQDIDAWVSDSPDMKLAANRVGDKLGLPYGWFNDSLRMTSSYSPELRAASVHYRTFANVVDVRVVPDECLIAMKLKSGRDYKHDYSDIAGIVKENADNGCPLTREKIESAVEKLYGDTDAVPERSWEFLDAILKDPGNDGFLETRFETENENRELIDDFLKQNPQDIGPGNVDDVLQTLKEKDSNPDSPESFLKTLLLENDREDTKMDDPVDNGSFDIGDWEDEDDWDDPVD